MSITSDSIDPSKHSKADDEKHDDGTALVDAPKGLGPDHVDTDVALVETPESKARKEADKDKS